MNFYEPSEMSFNEINKYLNSLPEDRRKFSRYYWFIEKETVNELGNKLIQTTYKDTFKN